MILDKLIIASSFQTATKWLNRVISIISAVVLARILDPEDFGLLALAVSVITIFESFTSIGLNAKLIQGKNIREEHYNVAWTYGSILRSIILYLIIFFLSDFISKFYEKDELSLVIKVLGLKHLVNGFGNVWLIELIKEIDFKIKFYANLSGSLARLIFIIPLALYLRSVWALVIGLILQSSFMVLSEGILIKKKPNLDFNIKIFRELLSFGIPLLGSQILLSVRNSIDKLVIGKLLTTQSLGFYHIANRFGFEITSEIKSIISSLLFPAFSKLKNQDKDLKIPLFDSLFVTLLISTPPILFLLFNSESIVIFILGEKWIAASNPLKILVIGGYFQIINSIFIPFFKSSGKPGYEFILIAFQLLLLSLLIFKLKVYGIQGIAIANSITIFISVFLVLILAKKIISFSILEILVKMSPLYFLLLFNLLIDISLGDQNLFLIAIILLVGTLVYYFILVRYLKIEILLRILSGFTRIIKSKF